MSELKRSIWVTFSKIGFHNYPVAPDEVAYLKDRHRHKFNFKVTIDVFSDDREIEFHMFLTKIESFFETKSLEVDNASCEMLAERLINSICQTYDCTYRTVSVEVSEDGECGAIVTRRYVKGYPV
jgi:hypothetical protein